MAATEFARGGTHTNLVPEKWSSKDFKFAFESNPLRAYMGTSAKSIIQVNKDFLKAKGDKLTFGLRALLSGNGQGSDGTYEGNEEAMTFHDFSVEIAERGHSTKLNGNMTEQSAFRNLRDSGKEAIKEWWGRIIARDVIDSLSGLASMEFSGVKSGVAATDVSGNAIATVNQVAVSGTKSTSHTRFWAGGQASDGTIERVANDAAIDSSTSNLFGTAVIDAVKRMATATINSTGLAVSPIRPVFVNGKAHYLMLIHPLQMKSLRSETAWKEAQQYANLRGLNNPLFSGAEGIWNGVVIRETDLLHTRYGINGTAATEYFDSSADVCASGVQVARSLFLGAQSSCMAYGKMPVWKEGYCDAPHDTKWAVHTDTIYGVKKSYFNSLEFGSIIVDTAVVGDS